MLAGRFLLPILVSVGSKYIGLRQDQPSEGLLFVRSGCISKRYVAVTLEVTRNRVAWFAAQVSYWGNRSDALS